MYRKRASRWKKALTRANVVIAQLSSKKHTDMDTAMCVIAKYLSGAAYHLVVAQLTISLKRNKKRWTKEMKLYCLSLYYKSPSAYRFLRKTFAVPSVRTLQRIFRNYIVECGFSTDLMSILKHKVANMSELEKSCSICLDEMSIKCALSYNATSDRIDGFENMGSIGCSQGIGKQALVFMATGLFSNWKQPLGFFISKSSTPGPKLKILLEECVSLLTDIGLYVKCVICDQGSSNQKLVKLLNVTVDKPYFVQNENKVFVFYDPPHLLKSVRNNLQKHNFMLDDHILCWSYLQKLYQIESSKTTMLRLAPKLTQRHIDLPAFSKMKVKRAAQVFSNTVQAAMLTYICSGDLPSEAFYTATFLKKVDSLFDIFNSSSLLDSKPFKCALKEGSPSFDFLKMMKSTFERLTVLGLKTQPPCMKGWVMTINALLCLWDELKSLPNVKYLCTRRINQDPLENCFSVVRSKGGFCDNPTPKQFTAAYKQILIQCCISQSELSNCESDVNNVLLDVFGRQLPQGSVGVVTTETQNKELDIEYEQLIGTISTVNANALVYVAGYTCRTYLSKHSDCTNCSKLLQGRTHLEGKTADDMVFIQNKAYSNCSGACGGLCVPSTELVSFITQCEQVFSSNFMSMLHMSKVCDRLVNAILRNVEMSWFSSTGCSANIPLIVRIYMKMRIFYAVKFFNQSLTEQPRQKRNRKALKLAHL